MTLRFPPISRTTLQIMEDSLLRTQTTFLSSFLSVALCIVGAYAMSVPAVSEKRGWKKKVKKGNSKTAKIIGGSK